MSCFQYQAKTWQSFTQPPQRGTLRSLQGSRLEAKDSARFPEENTSRIRTCALFRQDSRLLPCSKKRSGKQEGTSSTCLLHKTYYPRSGMEASQSLCFRPEKNLHLLPITFSTSIWTSPRPWLQKILEEVQSRG